MNSSSLLCSLESPATSPNPKHSKLSVEEKAVEEEDRVDGEDAATATTIAVDLSSLNLDTPPLRQNDVVESFSAATTQAPRRGNQCSPLVSRRKQVLWGLYQNPEYSK